MIDVQTINTTINIIGAIIGSTGFSAIIVQGFKFLKQIGVDKKIKNVDTLVHKAINFASQKGFNLSLDNDKMYNIALTWVKNEASKNGIKYSDDEWEGFIESIYKMLKNDWALADKNSALNHSNISSNTIAPSIELPSLEWQNLANNEVVKSAESVSTVGVEGDSTETQKSTVLPVVVSEDMMKEINNAVLAKATSDATKVINVVIENVQKSISDSEEK